MRRLKFIYIIGQPGSGKTTLINAFLAQFNRDTQTTIPFKHETYSKAAVSVTSLGWQTGAFGGTDTLPNTVIEKVISHLPQINTTLVIAEGDRLANKRFFDAAQEFSDFIPVFLNTDNEIAAERRQIRSTTLNKPPQNSTWIKGRISKSRNLANFYKCIEIQGDAPISEQLKILNGIACLE